MSERLGYSREGDTVVLRMHLEDYNRLLMTLGFAAGAGGLNMFNVLDLANRLNRGNPHWTPYEFHPGPRDA